MKPNRDSESPRKSGISEKILPILISGLISFFVGQYLERLRSNEVLNQNRVATFDALVDAGQGMASTMKLMKTMACEFGKKRLSKVEENQQTLLLQEKIDATNALEEKLDNRLMVYFPDAEVSRRMLHLRSEYSSALDDFQNLINRTIANPRGCSEEENERLLKKHYDALSARTGAIHDLMRQKLGIPQTILMGE